MENKAKKPSFLFLQFNFCQWVVLSCCIASGEKEKDYVPIDNILLRCGAPPKTSDTDGRTWYSDVGSNFTSATDSSSTVSRANVQDPSVPEVPYMHARIFHCQYTYRFPVTPGRIFIRLYFYPGPYTGLNPSDAIFSVTAGSYTLLKNFSAAQTAKALEISYITKEFSVNVHFQALNLTFRPNPFGVKNNSYGFVNGIEIVSHPDIYNTENGTGSFVGRSVPFVIDNRTAMENIYRLNVGGNFISPADDTGLFRSWQVDSSYIFGAASGAYGKVHPNVTITFPPGTPSYLAPIDVYATFRSMGPTPAGSNDVVENEEIFEIFLNNQTAERRLDVQDLFVALHPITTDAFLNGLEIFKLNDSTGNLGGPNPVPAPLLEIPPQHLKSICSSCTGHSKIQKRLMIGIGSAILFALTTRSDVYSFGVVLFEILCACPAVDMNSDEEIGLAGWAAESYEKGDLHQIMDPYLKGKIAPECFLKFAETAVRCVAEVGISRPSMGDVLRNLELALQLQVTAEEAIGNASGHGVEQEELEARLIQMPHKPW
ncbi:OLC1v1006832C1 [Oldenlandia corymbosa var. corymbosa]|uniref:OLC1v1006832C1 n=1 Tax=Oldenlandia corymbosa var. corymbosa TaxID=529605 RepID=A0AAV1DKN4_OLDCO|nr:OLC1v1006832C1 [Oldenlandia corymbosa var. corymbosa]